jgi:hypothetical protein
MNKSRFAILSEDLNKQETNFKKNNEIKEQPKILNKNIINNNIININNTFKRSYNEKRLSNSEYIRVKDNESKIKKEEEKKKLEDDKKQSLSKENFPELSKLVVKHKEPSAINFVHKLNQTVKTELVENKTENGWITIRYDKSTSQIVMIFDETDEDSIIEPLSESEDVLTIHNTMVALAELHKRRTEEYIELWGKEDWEKSFLFANDEYNYLDEKEYEDDLIDSPELYFENDYLMDDIEY